MPVSAFLFKRTLYASWRSVAEVHRLRAGAVSFSTETGLRRTLGRRAVAAVIGLRSAVLRCNARFGGLDVLRVRGAVVERVVACLFQLHELFANLRAGQRLVRLGKRNNRGGQKIGRA